MSRVASWDAATWLWAGLWSLMIVLGIVELFRTWRSEPARANDWELRHGESADLTVKPQRFERIFSVIIIVFGSMQLLTLRPGEHGGPGAVVLGIFFVALGLWALLYDRAFAARLRRGTDAHFEEPRALEAYPPSPPSATSRGRIALGALYIVFGGAMIAVNLDK